MGGYMKQRSFTGTSLTVDAKSDNLLRKSSMPRAKYGGTDANQCSSFHNRDFVIRRHPH